MSANEAGASTDIQGRFADAYRDYAKALAEIWEPTDVQRGFAEAYRNYIQTLGELAAPQDLQQRLADATRDYARALGELTTSSEPTQPLVSEAQRTYLRLLEERFSVPNEAQQRLAEAYAQYVRTLGEVLASGDVEKRSDEAYRNYLQALKDAWGTLKVEDLHPSNLAMINLSTMAAAGVTGATAEAIKHRGQAAAAMGSVGAPA
jgi:tetratricopeptide (TPR) repeat protein